MSSLAFLKQISRNFLTRSHPTISKTPSRYHSDQPSDFQEKQTTPICVKTETPLLALYGGRHTVTMLPGTGIGPELCGYVRTIFKKMGAPVDFEIVDINPQKPNEEELNYALVSIKRNGVALKGNLERQAEDPATKPGNVALRDELDLFAYVLWCKSYPGVPAKHENLDIVLIRQNTEGEYSMLEHAIGDDKVVENLKIVRRDQSVRLATYAFEYAMKHGRKKVSTIHKANIMKLSDGLFLKVAKEVAKNYPNIEHNDLIIDNCCMQLVSNPQQFDVILAPNLYGSIIANVICGISGGPGLMAGKNDGAHYVIFETGTRNSGTTIAGKNVANPVAMLNASVSMLYHLGHAKYARRLDKAIFKTVSVDKVHTPDLKGKATSSDVIENVIRNL